MSTTINKSDPLVVVDRRDGLCKKGIVETDEVDVWRVNKNSNVGLLLQELGSVTQKSVTSCV